MNHKQKLQYVTIIINCKNENKHTSIYWELQEIGLGLKGLGHDFYRKLYFVFNVNNVLLRYS